MRSRRPSASRLFGATLGPKKLPCSREVSPLPKNPTGALAKWRKQVLSSDEPGTWKPPPAEAQLEAIGLECGSSALIKLAQGQELEIQLEELYPEAHRNAVAMHKLQRVLQPVSPIFMPQLVPIPGTWMFNSREKPQTFEDYVLENPMMPTHQQHTIYLMPLTKPGGDSAQVGALPNMQILRAFIEAWFGLPCKVLQFEAVHQGRGVAVRSNGHGDDVQYHAQDAIRQLRVHLPTDGYCILGITMDDIFDSEKSFVFSKRSLKDRAGIFSFCRMDPAWYRVSCKMDMDTMKMVQDYPKQRQIGDQDTTMRRAHGILSHELGNLVGMRHCQFYVCRMQGTSGLSESDTKHDKVDLCPVCLRKLSWCIACGTQENAPQDIAAWCIDRYRRLLDHCERVGAPVELHSNWLRGRLAQLDRGVCPAAAAAPAAVAEAAIAMANTALDEWDPSRGPLPAHGQSGKSETAAVQEADLLMIFARHDEDGDGKMKIDEFCRLIGSIDESLSNFSAMKMFNAADVNKDGVVDVREFLSWLLTPQDDPGVAEKRILARLAAETKMSKNASCFGDSFDDEIMSPSKIFIRGV